MVSCNMYRPSFVCRISSGIGLGCLASPWLCSQSLFGLEAMVTVNKCEDSSHVAHFSLQGWKIAILASGLFAMLVSLLVQTSARLVIFRTSEFPVRNLEHHNIRTTQFKFCDQKTIYTSKLCNFQLFVTWLPRIRIALRRKLTAPEEPKLRPLIQ